MTPIELTKEQYSDLLDIQAESKFGRFACNRSGEVWPKPVLGFTHPEDRDDKAGAHPVLDEIVLAVLEEQYSGGDFYVRREGAYLASDDRQIVVFIPDYEWEEDDEW